MTRTRWPATTFPVSRTACSAVSPEMGTTAACSNVRVAGLGAHLSWRTAAYSAKDPSHVP